MFSICIAAAIIHFNNWVNDHSWAVTDIMYVSATVAVACFLFWLFSKKGTPRPLQETHGAGSTVTAVGNIGKVGIGASVKIGGDIHHHHGPIILPRPRVALVEYGQIPENYPLPLHVGQTGFHLANDGETAYQVLIQPFEIESSVWTKSKECPRIEAQGRHFALVWLDGFSPSPLDVGKWDLLGAMKRAADRRDGQLMYRPDYSIDVSVVYRDADNHWYRTTAPLSYVPSQHRLECGSPTFESTQEKEQSEIRDVGNENRPKLLVEIDWCDAPESPGGFKVSLQRPLTLVNDSETPAVNAKLLPIRMAGHTAKFKCESVIRKGHPVKAHVDVDGFGSLQRFDLHWMLEKESTNTGTLDVHVPIFIEYEDTDGQTYETEQEMIYDVFMRNGEFRLIYQGIKR
jgi:hypothetical protein